MVKKALLAVLCLALCLAMAGCVEQKTPDAAKETVPLKQKAEGVLADYASLVAMPAEDLEDMTGITSDMVTEFIYLQGEDALSGREVLCFRAVDASAAEQVKKLTENYLENRKKETRNYLPEAYKLQENAAVESKNLTVVLCIGESGREENTAMLAGE